MRGSTGFIVVGDIRADDLVAERGQALVGVKVWTPPMGHYPGGFATITEVGHDANAPDIAFLVSRPTEGIMGVFEYEKVRLAS